MSDNSTSGSSEPKPVSEARLASTVLLLRQTAAEMEVFMVVRHHQIDFASGALVFPGGSVDAADREIAARADLIRGGGETDAGALALRVAAVRETFEECGILLARPHGSETLISAERLKAIGPPKTESAGAFRDFIAAERLELALDLLVPFAHWITPTAMPKRFDTHFFMAVAPADQVGIHDGHEAVDSVWIAPQRAVDEAHAGRFTLVFATERNLIRLARATSVEDAIARARAEPIVTVMPQVSKGDDGKRQLRIPKDAGYDGEVFAI
jgi:8-oxo-dGTP pyrophosphatase MutT (NUDIX family)